MGYVKGTLPVG